MIAKFNKTGTHRYEGFLKIRIDLYPEPHHKTFIIHYVQKPIREYTEEEIDNEALQDIVPKVWKLKPILSHFIIINPTLSRRNLIHMLKDIFDEESTTQFDNLLINPTAVSNIRKVGRILSRKNTYGKRLNRLMDNRLTEIEVNWRFRNLEVEVGSPI